MPRDQITHVKGSVVCNQYSVAILKSMEATKELHVDRFDLAKGWMQRMT